MSVVDKQTSRACNVLLVNLDTSNLNYFQQKGTCLISDTVYRCVFMNCAKLLISENNEKEKKRENSD